MGLFGIGNKAQEQKKTAFEQRVDRGKAKYPLIPRWIIRQSFKQVEKEEKPKQTFQQQNTQPQTTTETTYTEEKKQDGI